MAVAEMGLSPIDYLLFSSLFEEHSVGARSTVRILYYHPMPRDNRSIHWIFLFVSVLKYIVHVSYKPKKKTDMVPIITPDP